MLEETARPYRVHPIDIGQNEQHDPEFLKISPNNKIPAIVDRETGMTLMESGAILMYLAEKSGKFMPEGRGEPYWRVIEWLMFQMGGVGPLLGQTHHFVKYNPGKSEYAEQRYLAENRRVYGVLDHRLSQNEFLAGEYSIADIATWPWIARFDYQTMDLNEYSNLKRWYLDIAKRPAVQTGYYIPNKSQSIPMP